MSVFKDYTVDYDECFNSDLSRTKIAREIAQRLKKSYKNICDTFKTFKNALIYSQFVQFLSDNQIKLPEFLIDTWKEIHTSKKKAYIGRHQFLELIVACEGNGLMVLPAIDKIDLDSEESWKKELSKEITDVIFTLHKPILEFAYTRFINEKNLEGFCEFIEQSEIKVKNIDYCYYMSINTKSDDHHTMNYTEFLAALCRIASNANSELPFIKNLEMLMPAVQKVCPKRVQDIFKFPTPELYIKTMYTIL